MNDFFERLYGMPFEYQRYTLGNLAQHLYRAGHYKRLATLFDDDTWMKARFEGNLYTYEGFLADLDIAWKGILDHEAIDQNNSTMLKAFAEQVRYGLLRSSIASLVSGVPPKLLARSVQIDHWSTSRALAMLMRTADFRQRAVGYACLLETEKLSVTEQKQAEALGLEAALQVDNEQDKVHALLTLYAKLSQEQRDRALMAAFHSAINVAEDRYWGFIPRAGTLREIAPYLPNDLVELALETVWPIKKEGIRGYESLLAALAPYVKGAQLKRMLQEALTLDSLYKFVILEALAPQLHDRLLLRTLINLRKSRNNGSFSEYYARALAGLARNLRPTERQQALAEAISVALAIQYDRPRIETLVSLLPYLDSVQQHSVALTVMDSVLTLEDWTQGIEMLIKLMPYLQDVQHERALSQGLDRTAKMSDVASRALGLGQLAQWMYEKDRNEILSNALEAALTIEDKQSRIRVLDQLAPYFERPLLERALKAAQSIEDEAQRAETWSALIPLLYEDRKEAVLSWALSAATRTKDPASRVQALRKVCHYLEGDQRERAIENAFHSSLRLSREEVLSFGVPEALSPCAEALISLTGQLRGEQITEALQAVATLESEMDRSKVLVALCPYLHDEYLVNQALDIAIAIVFGMSGNEEPLIAIASRLQGKQVERALDVAQKIANQPSQGPSSRKKRARVLAALVPQLQAAQMQLIFDTASGMEDEESRALIFQALVPFLQDEQQIADLLQIVISIMPRTANLLLGSWVRDPHLLLLETLLPRLQPEQVDRVFHEVKTIQDTGGRTQLLQLLLPYLPYEQVEEIFRGDPAAKEKRFLQFLAALVPWLRGLRRQEAIAQFLHLYVPSDEYFSLSIWTRLRILTFLVTYTEGDQRELMFKLALEVALSFSVWDTAWDGSSLIPSRISALLEMASELENGEREHVLSLAWEAALALEPGWLRDKAFVMLAKQYPSFAQSSVSALRLLLIERLFNLSSEERPSFLQYVTTALPVWSLLTTTSMAGEIAEGIKQVCEEWHWQ